MKAVTLNGAWKFGECGSAERFPVTVPGTVLSGLLDNGKIEDPFYRDNEYQTRELFWKDYEFIREFEVEEKLLSEEKILLVCEGLDTLADVYINDTKVLSADNMHRTWKVPVKSALVCGTNRIRIEFGSVLKFIENYPYRENREIRYVPCGAMKGNELIRKAHSMFGWDWGPQLIDAGIFRNIYLEAYSGAKLDDVQIRQEHEAERVWLDVQTKLDGAAEDGARIRVSVEGEVNTEIPADGDGRARLLLEHPKKWWPNGYGEQNLYTVTVELLAEDGSVRDVVKKRIGIRTLTISQEKDQWGQEFAFIVNGVKIFTKGGNYIPEDCCYTRITKERQEYLVRSCVRANFNCLRVWGGGYYPSDAFYDLCDEYGLIVWQDLMYACNVYDVTDAFAENIRQETLDNVRRLRHHACLGLWCGNNEIESAWDHWGDFQKETPYLRADYVKQFEYILPHAVREADPDTFYWPSSPSSGGCFDEPDSEDRGDTHYWDVWHGQKPFSDYRKYFFRFCSEFGFQSFPSYKTVESFTEEEDRNIFSKVMESHQKNDAANGKMLYYLSENFRYPKDFKSLLYVTQILQAMAIKSGVEHWRRNRGRCMGTLYWQVNDNWPVASWASIDYFGRWKALHYAAKHFYAQTAASICLAGETAGVYLENETMRGQQYEAKLILKTLDLEVLDCVEKKGTVKELSSELLIEKDYGALLKERDKEEVFLEAVVTLSDGTVLKETEIFVPYKYLKLKNPQVEVTVTEEKDEYQIHLCADTFVPFLELDFADADAVFGDNYLMLTERKETVVTLKKEDITQGSFADAEDLRKRLVCRSVADTY